MMNKKIIGLTGLATLGLAVMPLSSVFADTPTELKSEGTVGFIENQDPHKPLNPLNPFDPDSGAQNNVVPKDGQTNTSDTHGNQLTLDYVPSFRFGVNNNVTTGARNSLFASALSIGETTVPNYAQVTDLRDSKTSGWALNVTQDDDWTSTNGETIPGAQIKFNNVQSAISGQKASFLAPEAKNGVIIEKGAKVNIMNAASAKDTASRVGYGSWLYAIGNDTTKGSSVQLTVPDNTILSATTYKTNLTWSLEDTAATN